jgi:hypothetical protein
MKAKITHTVERGITKEIHYEIKDLDGVGFVVVPELHAWSILKAGDELNLTL